MKLELDSDTSRWEYKDTTDCTAAHSELVHRAGNSVHVQFLPLSSPKCKGVRERMLMEMNSVKLFYGKLKNGLDGRLRYVKGMYEEQANYDLIWNISMRWWECTPQQA